MDGVDAGRGQAPRPLIMLHYDEGANTAGTKTFLDRFQEYGIPYDIIGLSYYPWWHGNLLGLRDNILTILDNHHDKDVIVVEVGYRPHEYDENELPPFPADAAGGPRKAFLEAVNETLLGISSRRVKGIFWWEPASDCGRDYFDENCNSLPVITVFDRFKRR
jgi:arabinogalactan endo-1,4-beta-galactosidase